MIHKAGGIDDRGGHPVRDVLMFEFNAKNKSMLLREIDEGIPCGVGNQQTVEL